jgi:hypothetical protein
MEEKTCSKCSAKKTWEEVCPSCFKDENKQDTSANAEVEKQNENE